MLDSLSTASKLQIVKLRGDTPYLILITVDFGDGNIFNIVKNTEDVTFRGTRFYKYNFDFDDLTDDGKQLPKLTLKVSNVLRAAQLIVDQFNGGTGALVYLYIVNAQNLSAGIADLEEEFVVQETACDPKTVTFTLGADYNLRSRFPKTRIMKNHCTHAEYGGIECGCSLAVKATFPTCPRTIIACRERGNASRFGAEPGIPQGGLYAY